MLKGSQERTEKKVKQYSLTPDCSSYAQCHVTMHMHVGWNTRATGCLKGSHITTVSWLFGFHHIIIYILYIYIYYIYIYIYIYYITPLVEGNIYIYRYGIINK